MDFCEAIKKGIEAAEDKEANMKEIREIISQANEEIFEFCGMMNGFIELKGDSFVCNEVVQRFLHNSNYGYPIKIDSYGKHYECDNSEEFVDCIKSILSSSAFGTKVRRFKGDI